MRRVANPRQEALQEWILSQAAVDRAGAIRPRSIASPTRSSLSQRSIWLQSQIGSTGAEENVVVAWRLFGELDVPALQQALNSVISRHAILRTRLVVGADGEPWQHQVDPGVVTLQPESIEANALEATLRRLASEPIDVAQTTMARPQLLRIASADHVLLIRSHHIVMDEWSVGILARELSAAYTSLHFGRQPELPNLPIQYADYAEWQRDRLSGDYLESLLDYWVVRLRSVPLVLNLPTDWPTDGMRAIQTSSVRFEISAALLARLDALAMSHGATRFMVFLAAYELLLSRWTGQDEFVVGTSVANRPVTDCELIIGQFVNTLPIVARMDERATFGQLLDHVRDVTVEALEYQELPLDLMIQEVGQDRAPGRAPVIQVGFVLHGPVHQLSMPGLEVSQLDIASPAIRNELLLGLSPSGAGLAGEMAYAADRFNPSTVSNLARRYEKLLDDLAAKPDLELRRIEATPASEGTAILIGSRGVRVSQQEVSSLPVRVSLHAYLHPDQTAVVQSEESLTYRQLLTKVRHTAAVLTNGGIGTESPVAVLLPTSGDLVVALLAVWSAGAVYLPLDVSQPDARLTQIAQDVSPVAIVTNRTLAARAGAFAPEVILIDDLPEAPHPGPLREPPPDARAYIVYTSGSSGIPRGVEVTYRNVAHFLAGIDHLNAGHGPGVCVVSPAFDGSLWCLLLSLAHGETVALFGPPLTGDLEALAEALDRLRPGVVSMTPSLLASLPSRIRSAHTIIAAGEFCSEALAREWASGRRFLNVYGPTETTISATWADSAAGGDLSTIGRPQPNVCAYVLDSCRRLCPIGVAGELFLSGPGVSRGYRDQPGLTAARFVPDPYVTTGERMYRTGDRARWRSHGQIEFLGRIDRQLKVRGYRIEPDEIERVLLELTGVEAAAVMPAPDVGGGADMLVAVVAARPAVQTEVRAAAERACRSRLPEYMRPARILCVEAIPVTRRGKTDVDQLRSLLEVKTQLPAVTQLTATEERVAALWSALLGAPVTDRDRSFFDLGGHSLLATRAVVLIREQFKVPFSVRTLFARPQLRDVAAEIDRHMTAPGSRSPS